MFIFFSFYGLELKPIHHDESVNAWWLTQISELGYFPYDPTNYHGPLFFYIQWIFQQILGDELWVLRSVGVLFGIFSVISLWRRGYRWGASAMALSPAMVFFSRSAIHEPLFVFFQLQLLLGTIDAIEQKKTAPLWIVIGLVGSMAIKETWVVSLMAGIPALYVLGAHRLRPRNEIFLWVGFAIFFWAILFSGFFQNLAGLIDFFKAFMPWLQVGTQGSGHNKPLWFWVGTITCYEIFVLLVMLIYPKDQKAKAIFIFGWMQLLIYSLIPYKTVWCLISIIWPFFLLMDSFRQRFLNRFFVYPVILLILVWQLFWIYSLVFKDPIHFDHPYVYVQSSQELKNFSESVVNDIKNNPEISKEPVLVLMQDAWPFPWVFRHHLKVQFVNQAMSEEQVFKSLSEANLIVCDQKYRSLVDSSKKFSLERKFFLRDESTEVFIYKRLP